MSFIRAILFALLFCLSQFAVGAEVFSQPPRASGGQHKSAFYAPDGIDGDIYCYESFTLPNATAITAVHWRGAYTNYLSGAGKAPVSSFTIAIHATSVVPSQPDVINPPLYKFNVGSNAGETSAGIFGGYEMFDYAATFPVPFQAVAGVKYWVQIEAWQGLTPVYYWPPDWSWAVGTGGNGSHFRKVSGEGPMFQTITDDLSFSLYASDAPTVTIDASASPLIGGTVTGAGSYPINSIASLTATANPGFGFINWTENSNQVSANPHYTFAATTNRTLVANFIASHTISTSTYPEYAGTVTGAGIYNESATVTLAATPNHGFVFSQWSDGSTDNPYLFPATTDILLYAFFDSAPNSTTFDFDNGPVSVSLPLTYTQSGISATLSGGFSMQPYGSVGLAPAGMSGIYIFPNSVFPADLFVDFSRTLVDFSILYSPQEIGCDTSATMRVTAFLNGAEVGTATATAPVPGTYPTGTLPITVPGGFNSVVVHYDHRPLTCQDYGPIFLADIMTVTMLPCPADLNGDGLVDDADFVIFANAYDTLVCSDPLMPPGCPADLNGNTLVDDTDFVLFVDAYNALLCP